MSSASTPAAAAGAAAPSLSRAQLAALIDHTLLKPEATAADIIRLCSEARDHHFASVCVNSCWVKLAKSQLGDCGVRVCSVVGFPLGCMDSASKAFEAQTAIANGATEIDMVLHIGSLKAATTEGDAQVEADIRAVVDAVPGHIVKVIFETGLLSTEEKIRACRLSEKAGAAFVKTSTGFVSGSIATVADIELMRANVSAKIGVKASGGVKTTADAERMVKAGATRIGTSSGVAIVTGAAAANAAPAAY